MTLSQTLPLRQVICGDCIEVMRMIPNESVDCLISDPPYGVNYIQRNREIKMDKLDNDDSLIWFEDFVKESARVLIDNSHFYCFVAFKHMDITISVVKKYFTLSNIITVKRRHLSGVWNPWEYRLSTEFVIFANKGKRAVNQTIYKRSVGGGTDPRQPRLYCLALPDLVDYIPSSEFNLDLVHPTQKSVEIIELFLNVSTNEGDIILDPFLGSGTTAVACEKLRRKWIGIEINKDYCEIARKRLEPWMNQSRLDTLTQETI